MTCNTLGIVLSIWGIKTEPEKLAELCKSSQKIELKKKDEYALHKNTIVAILYGILELNNSLFTAGDVLYIDNEKKAICVSSSCTLIETSEEIAEKIFDNETLLKIKDSLRVPKVEIHDVPVKYFIRKLPITVSPDLTIRDAAKIMAEHNVSSIIVVDNNRKPIGIITDTDLRKFSAYGENLDKKLGDVATKNLIVSNENDSVSVALEKMLFYGIKHMIIVNDAGRTVGMVTLRDLYDAFTAVPISYIRDLQKASSIDEILITYSRILRQTLNVLRRRRVDVLEFSRNFTMAKMLTLTKLLSYTCDEFSNKVAVMVSQPLSSYDYVFGEEFTIYVIGKQDNALNEVTLRLRTSLSKLLDIGETVKVENISVDELSNLSEDDTRLLDVLLLSRHIWGSADLLQSFYNVENENIFTKIIKCFRNYISSIEIPLDIFGRLKFRHINVYRYIVEPISKLVSVLYYMATRMRPFLNVKNMIDILRKGEVLDKDLLESLSVIYDEIKQLELNIAVKNYIDKATPSTEVDISELSEAELYHIKYAFDMLKTIKDRVRDFLGKYVAV